MKKTRVLAFNFKRNCGLWLLIIGLVIILATAFGGNFLLNPFIFMGGYALGFYIANINKTVHNKLACGGGSAFQYRAGNLSVVLLFVLLLCISGPFFITMNWRMIWLGAFLATGLHFFPFYFVHGKSMPAIAAVCCASAVTGMLATDVPFYVFSYLDGCIKLAFGIYLLWFSRPSTNRG